MNIYLSYQWIPSYFIPQSLNSEVRRLKRRLLVEEKSQNNHYNVEIINQDTVKLCNGRSRLLYWYANNPLKILKILGLLHIINSRIVKNQPICITRQNNLFFFKEVSGFVFINFKHHNIYINSLTFLSEFGNWFIGSPMIYHLQHNTFNTFF